MHTKADENRGEGRGVSRGERRGESKARREETNVENSDEGRGKIRACEESIGVDEDIITSAMSDSTSPTPSHMCSAKGKIV